MKRYLSAILGAALALCLSASAQAASVLVDPSAWTGSRTTPDASGIHANGVWATNGLMLSWVITFDSGTNLYTYKYTLSDDASKTTPIVQGDISHFDIEVSDTFTSANIKAGSSSSIVGPETLGDEGGSSPGIPSTFYGIKFDTGGSNPTYTLITDRAPIWGDFYTKDGVAGGAGDNYAYNTGFGTDPTLSTVNFTAWIATPDTVTTNVPVPASAWAGLALLTGLGVVQLVRRRMAA